MTPQLEKVKDPNTGLTMSLEEAVNKGLIDGTKSLVVDPDSGKAISLCEALQQGVVDGDAGKIKDTDGQYISPQEAEKKGLMPAGSILAEITKPGLEDPHTSKIKDSVSGREPAAEKGLVHGDKSLVTDPTSGSNESSKVVNPFATTKEGLIPLSLFSGRCNFSWPHGPNNWQGD